ncbi:MAG: hypothetical protein GY750_11495 [Lentisphaerae bacterium]|nr:hypothetical protein [Lentisphaerota bacterium]MCP4102038.1 hypothetical protein [Lentisphaerota bacterium]
MNTHISKFKSNMILAVGIIGLATFTAGLPVDSHITRNILFAVGAVLLTISSFWEKEYFFSCLEVIAFIAAILALCQVGSTASSIVMAVLTVVTIAFMSRIRKIDTRLCLGILGLVLLTAGIIFATNLIMIAAGVVLCIYSWLSLRAGYKVGWVFLVLNIIFTAVAVFSTIQYLA